MKWIAREVPRAACSIARVGVMPTPPLIRTSGLSLLCSVKLPEGGNSSSVSPSLMWSCRWLEATPSPWRLTLMRYSRPLGGADRE